MMRRFFPSTIRVAGGIDYSTFEVIYSIARLVNPSYGGSAFRVRRDSDGTQQDIGFVGTDIDTAAIETFCTGTTGRIQNVYNQGTLGTGWDQLYVSGTRSIIYQSGAVELVNAKPAILGQTSNLYQAGGGGKPIADTIMAKNKIVSGVIQTQSGASLQAFFGERAFGIAGNHRRGMASDTTTSRILYDLTITGGISNSSFLLVQATQNQQRLYSLLTDASRATTITRSLSYYNGNFQDGKNEDNLWNPSSTIVSLYLMVNQFTFLGKFQEVVYKEIGESNPDDDELLSDVIAEQNAYYGIY